MVFQQKLHYNVRVLPVQKDNDELQDYIIEHWYPLVDFFWFHFKRRRPSVVRTFTTSIDVDLLITDLIKMVTSEMGDECRSILVSSICDYVTSPCNTTVKSSIVISC